MLEVNDLRGASIQRLSDEVSAANGSTGVPSVIRHKRGDIDEEDSTSTSSKKSMKSNELGRLSTSIEKHGESMVTVAKIAAAQQESVALLSASQQEKNRIQESANYFRSRINSLRDLKRNLLLQLASSGASVNKPITDAILDEVQKIEMEIDENRNELNSVIGTPQKSNCSPN
jgi:hypothetical protein